MPIDWTQFVRHIRAHEKFVLTSHVRPDCDALGSELGLAGVLEALGKSVAIINPDPTPPNLRFIDPEKRIRALGRDAQPADAHATDVLIVLDTSAWLQLGDMAEVMRQSRAMKLVLDHHVSQDDLGAIVFKDPRAEATGRLVWQAARELGVSITERIARPLFAAVATDTGWFRFSSTTGETYRCAADLVEHGANPQEIYRALYEHDTLSRIHLVGRSLAKTQVELGGRLVFTTVEQSDFTATGALPSDTEDLINITLRVAGSEVAVMLVELAAGGVKASFRSRGGFDCSRVAELFQGGGHKAAAGATLHVTLAQAQALVLDAVRQAMR